MPFRCLWVCSNYSSNTRQKVPIVTYFRRETRTNVVKPLSSQVYLWPSFCWSVIDSLETVPTEKITRVTWDRLYKLRTTESHFDVKATTGVSVQCITHCITATSYSEHCRATETSNDKCSPRGTIPKLHVDFTFRVCMSSLYMYT